MILITYLPDTVFYPLRSNVPLLLFVLSCALFLTPSESGKLRAPRPKLQRMSPRLSPSADDAGFREDVQNLFHVYAGQSVTLPCFVRNVNLEDVVISWWKEGDMRELTLGSMVSSPRYQLRHTSPQDWSLRIVGLQESDSGIYLCQINLNDVLEKPFRVVVTDMQPEPELPSNDQSSNRQVNTPPHEPDPAPQLPPAPKVPDSPPEDTKKREEQPPKPASPETPSENEVVAAKNQANTATESLRMCISRWIPGLTSLIVSLFLLQRSPALFVLSVAILHG